MELNECMQQILGLTEEIEKKINLGELGCVDFILTERLDFINELIACSLLEENKEKIKNYLYIIRQHDESIMKYIYQAQSEIKNVLVNLEKLEEYADYSE